MSLRDEDRDKLADMRASLDRGRFADNPVSEPVRAVVVPESECPEPDGATVANPDSDETEVTKHQLMLVMTGQCPWCGGTS